MGGPFAYGIQSDSFMTGELCESVVSRDQNVLSNKTSEKWEQADHNKAHICKMKQLNAYMSLPRNIHHKSMDLDPDDLGS